MEVKPFFHNLCFGEITTLLCNLIFSSANSAATPRLVVKMNSLSCPRVRSEDNILLSSVSVPVYTRLYVEFTAIVISTEIKHELIDHG